MHPRRVRQSHPGGIPPHLYVHVPFCDGICRYCGFFRQSGVSPETLAAYAGLPALELQRLAGKTLPVPETLYVGGGTPTALGSALDRLLATLATVIRKDRLQEWTVEASPQHVSREQACRWRDRGVTRISLGAQAFDDGVLQAMGRRHRTADTRRAVQDVRLAGGLSLSLDLIAGWPGVTPGGWRRTLDAVLTLSPEHVSVYALSVEPESLLARETAWSASPVPDDAAVLDALSEARHRLAQAGFQRYEISNYALPGFACRHNLAVWRGGDYLGLGPSAASRQGRRRNTKVPDLTGYCRALSAGRLPPAATEQLSESDDCEERFLTGLRLDEGVDPAAFVVADGRAAHRQRNARRKVLVDLASLGLTVPGGRGWRLTDRGCEVADSVMEALIGLSE